MVFRVDGSVFRRHGQVKGEVSKRRRNGSANELLSCRGLEAKDKLCRAHVVDDCHSQAEQRATLNAA